MAFAQPPSTRLKMPYYAYFSEDDINRLALLSPYFAAVLRHRQFRDAPLDISTPSPWLTPFTTELLLHIVVADNIPVEELLSFDPRELLAFCNYFDFPALRAALPNIYSFLGINQAHLYFNALCEIDPIPQHAEQFLQTLSTFFDVSIDEISNVPLSVHLDFLKDAEFRIGRFLPLCPLCYAYTPLDDTLILSPCCLETYHTSCWNYRRRTSPQKPCLICQTSTAPMDNIRTMNRLLEAKYFFWTNCYEHDGCVIHHRNDALVPQHRAQSRLLDLITSNVHPSCVLLNMIMYPPYPEVNDQNNDVPDPPLFDNLPAVALADNLDEELFDFFPSDSDSDLDDDDLRNLGIFP